MSFKKLVHFNYVIKFVGKELFLCYPFNIHGICSDVPAFTSDNSYLCKEYSLKGLVIKWTRSSQEKWVFQTSLNFFLTNKGTVLKPLFSQLLKLVLKMCDVKTYIHSTCVYSCHNSKRIREKLEKKNFMIKGDYLLNWQFNFPIIETQHLFP